MNIYKKKAYEYVKKHLKTLKKKKKHVSQFLKKFIMLKTRYIKSSLKKYM